MICSACSTSVDPYHSLQRTIMAEYGLHELEDKDLPKTVVRFSITETVLAGCVNVHLYDCG